MKHLSQLSAPTPSKTSLSRRLFLKKTTQAGAGLTLAFMLPGCKESQSSPQAYSGATAKAPAFEANAFVHLGSDNTVTVIIKHLEMGQGVYTGLATLVAEELDADWQRVRCESAPIDSEKYTYQSTGGSYSLAGSYLQMREAGAAARQMLVAAAAQQWQVAADEITVKQGQLLHPSSGHKATFGELAALAAKQAIPETVTLKDPANFTLIGQPHLSRKDSGKTNGTAIFTQDIQFPNLLTAVIAHAPKFGATVKQVDDAAAKAVSGVVAVVKLDNAVAVLATSFWQAKKARDQLKIDWDDSQAFQQSSDELFQHFRELAKTPGTPAKDSGDVDAAFQRAHQVHEATYEFPYLAHAAMEPLNCVVHLQGQGSQRRAEIWNGCQFQTVDQQAVAEELTIPLEKVSINTLLAGGSFGRRASSHSDYVIEAVRIGKAYGQDVPIKLVWTRENDTRAGYYRPMNVHRLKAGLDKQGNIIAWQHRIVGQSISAGTLYESIVKNGIDLMSVEGATNVPYQMPNQRVELHTVELPVPVLWWRSVASTHTAFSTEAFLDELAHLSQQDPLALRLKLLPPDSNHRRVLKLAADKAQWHAPLPKGRARGIALHKSFGTTVAQVAEVSLKEGGAYHVDKVTCAVDCGLAVNPDVVKAQMEGGIGFGLSPTMMSEVTFDQGQVVQSNFHDYQVVRMPDMPEVEVHIVPSAEPPTGVGEPATPVIGPAVANALQAATGKAWRRLPFKRR